MVAELVVSLPGAGGDGAGAAADLLVAHAETGAPAQRSRKRSPRTDSGTATPERCWRDPKGRNRAASEEIARNEPAEKRIPGQHEPRDPHSDEWRDRNDSACPG